MTDEVLRRLSLMCGRTINGVGDMTSVEIGMAINTLFAENAELRRELRDVEDQARLDDQGAMYRG